MSQDNTPLPRCGLLRRLAAILYDSLLLLAVLFIASALWLIPSGGEATAGQDPLLTLFLLLVAFAFFAWFWSHGGQTLGMRAWRIKLQNRNPGPLTLWQLMLRFIVAIFSWLAFGLGFLWSLIDKEKLTWHDRYSMSELVVTPKQRRDG
ncbi:MAG: RDD family protein [Gammaproteobacteria bacterium]|nr:RDD family protein [Gammaproteobacteria bacterium]MCW8959006.1 RDD family protein [Gammaproteobacteria bacterium]MCW8972832.1 RDD family protein [Gammaproteobacteria bacterium]MCW8992095.1 RDD family protein [Gammaproteobacteria bacterium]